MNKLKYSVEPLKTARFLLYQAALIVPVSVAIGSVVALFLWLLDLATTARWQHPWFIFFLPLAGVLITLLYKRYGKNSDAGNNLIMDEIHKPGGGIPARMTPFILFSTILTHITGGSAGREGTAVQMGGSIASAFSKWYGLQENNKRILLMCGMSAGFGAVFGTPVAGAIFAIEVLVIGRIKYNAFLPCLAAGILADITCSAYGIHHTQYSISFNKDSHHFFSFFSFDLWLLCKVIAAGILFGLTSYLFARSSHMLKELSGKLLRKKWLIPVVGGVAVIGISYGLGTFDYLGLGVTNPSGHNSIVSAFTANGTDAWGWFWKFLLTVITLSTGFKGGEVTPLFFIGAALGNTLAAVSGSPVDLFAGIGFIAVFAGAANTPLACTLMGIELFGSENMIYYAVACFIAYYFSGQAGIYHSQKIATPKFYVSWKRKTKE